MIGSKKLKMLYEIQSAMDQNKRKGFRYANTVAVDINSCASIYYRTEGGDTIYWFLYDLENISLSNLAIIKDRIKADLERIGKGADINEIKKELPVNENGDIDIAAFLQRFKEENQNEK